jgi:hypothetical protein
MRIKTLIASALTIVSIICYFTNNTLSNVIVQQDVKITQEFIKSNDLKTVMIRKAGTEFSIPAIELFSNEAIMLTFDDLSENPGTYSYTLTHCNSSWDSSSLFYSDYMNGFEVNEIRDFSFSSGAVPNYMHCKLEIPNNDVKLKISGNYLIKVFNTYNPEEILIQKRFLVYQSLAGIEATIRQPSAGLMRYSGQQLNLAVNTGNFRVTDPFNEIKTVVCQNNISQGCFMDIKPTFIDGSKIGYTHPDGLIFNGGNEYRIFDTKNIRYPGQGVSDITYKGTMFHALINTDKSRRNQKYSSISDFNGYYAVNLEGSSQANIEADYLWTYFSLKTPMELDEGNNVYLYGELTNWMLSPENKMVYNPIEGTYELSLLLKQGAYNYAYVVGNSSKNTVDFTHFEGSFFDTGNIYTILVYYKPMGARYERIIGLKQIGTL